MPSKQRLPVGYVLRNRVGLKRSELLGKGPQKATNTEITGTNIRYY